ncbi:MAG: hypothetical protein LBG95_05470 [Treponema sp.]|nr:hypothetical protein [Treponema sp.]
MNSDRKIAALALLFVLVTIFPICAETILSEEPSVSDKSSIGDEALSGEKPSLSEESPLGGESFVNEESFIGDDFFFEASPLIFEVAPFSGLRSFDVIFPGLSQSQKILALGSSGLKYSFEKGGSPMLLPDPDSEIDLLSGVMKKKPSHIIEALVIVPYGKRELDMLDVYNALGRIKEIKDHMFPYNGREIQFFVETTRLESARSRKPIPDPQPADMLPYSETMYLRFIDPYMGDLYIRGDISISLYGITYSMTNFIDVRYSIFRIMKAERFSAIIYLEPVKEGILVYSMSGIYLPGFIADRVNLTPNINGRISVLVSWITGGLRRQESEGHSSRFYRN